jgi:hypothetical protein
MLAFVIGDAAMFFSPCSFMVGFIKENFFNALRNAEGARAFTPLIIEYFNAAGWPIAVLSVASLIFALWLAWKPRYRSEMLLVMSMVVPYYLVVGGLHVSHLRYVVPLLPFILLLVGKMLAVFITQLPMMQRVVWGLVLAGTFLYSFLHVVAADLTFINDSRYRISNWIHDNLNADDSVEMTSYVSDTAYWFYNVTYRPHNNAEMATRVVLQKNDLYERVLRQVYKMEGWAKERGICLKERPTYESWHETAVRDYQRDTIGFDTGPQGLISRNPDWVIISDIYYKRFMNDEGGEEAVFFKQLMSGKLPYKLIHEEKYQGWLGMSPRVEFANPRLLVYQKQK